MAAQPTDVGPVIGNLHPGEDTISGGGGLPDDRTAANLFPAYRPGAPEPGPELGRAAMPSPLGRDIIHTVTNPAGVS